MQNDEDNSEEEHESSMAHISEHDSKEEGERHDGEDRGVHFLIHGHSISVNDLLEGEGEFVGLDIGWWHDGVIGEPLEIGCGVVLEDFFD